MALSVAAGLSSSALTPSPLPWRKGLWKAGIAWAVFVLTLAVGNAFISRNRAVTANMLGHDFMAFYTAGTCVREGRMGDLYNLTRSKAYQHELAHREGLEIRDSFGPFWNPPFYAMVFAPLAGLNFGIAQATWTSINLVCLIGAIGLLARMLPAEAGWKSRGLVVLLTLVSMPCIMALTHGQNTCTSLFILAGIVTLWRAAQRCRRGWRAVCCSTSRNWRPSSRSRSCLRFGSRTIVGLAITGALLLLVTVTLMPGMMETYLHQLPANVHFMQVEQPYLWHRHVTLKAFWRMLLQGLEPGEATAWTGSDLAESDDPGRGLADRRVAAAPRIRHLPAFPLTSRPTHRRDDCRDAVADAVLL